MRVIDIVEKDIMLLNTPCYILDVNHLNRNVNALLNGFTTKWSGKVISGYSVKTNSLPWLITYLKGKGFYAEVVSEQEYNLVKYLGFTNDKIILNGPVKSEQLLLETLNGGAVVNLDNDNEIVFLEKNYEKAEREWKVGLRYNFLLENECPEQTIVGGEHSRFGFCVENEDFARAIERVRRIPGVTVAGLHGHNSTRSKSLLVFETIVRKASELIHKYDINAEYIDVGGGFFGDKPGTPSFDEYANVMEEAFDGNPGTTLIIEPGASIISSPISYLCKVVNTKDVIEKRFVTVNGSRIHIDPMMHGIQFPKEIHTEYDWDDELEIHSKQELCGFTCIEMDRMGIIEGEKQLRSGDRILFKNCGSYSMTLSPLFISFFPTVYIYDDQSYKVVRYAWDETDFVRKCEVSL